MSLSITFEVKEASRVEKEIYDFYNSCGRQTCLASNDIVIIAKSSSQICGVVRLCFENGY